MNKLPKLCKFCIFTVLAILCAAIAAGCGRTVDGESAGSMYTVSGADSSLVRASAFTRYDNDGVSVSTIAFTPPLWPFTRSPGFR